MGEYNDMVTAFRRAPSFDSEKDMTNPPHIGYQYREFESFWAILKSDSFWATDARFSNDSQEQRFGTEILTHSLEGNSRPSIELNEDYIVCFCAEDDKLSQWRGYAPKGGVSMGFDFGGAVPFYIPLADKPLETGMARKDYRTVFVQSGWVHYVDPDEDIKVSRDRISSVVVPGEAASGAMLDRYEEDLKIAAPFIKHGGFQEENEWRLVFRNEDHSLSCCVRYHEPDDGGLRRPYIVVRPGDPAFNRRQSVVRVCVEDSIAAELLPRLRARLGNAVDSCRFDGGLHDKTDDFCFGCTRRRLTGVGSPCRYQIKGKILYDLNVRKNENSIIVSQGKDQERAFELVHTCVGDFLEDRRAAGNPADLIPVWCEGHLPVRSLTIGPCTHQREMVESIQHYCNHTYWLRDVKIGTSKIPFRRSI